MLLRHYLAQGLSKAALARQLGISRRTLYHWLATDQLDRALDEAPVQYRPRPAVARKIDPYRALVAERLAAYPQLSAVRLCAELQAAGYAGGYTQVKEHVRQVRPQPPPEPLVRFETPAGPGARSTSPSSRCRGASATPCWWCWATRGCCGCISLRAVIVADQRPAGGGVLVFVPHERLLSGKAKVGRWPASAPRGLIGWTAPAALLVSRFLTVVGRIGAG